MQVRAQIAMVMNLDKCIGCHTCSVTCKNVWTNRRGTEYVWFNDVETKPGVGYPKRWEDQERWKGGWELKGGKLRLKAGGRLRKLATLFFNPELPTLDDYYEPWTYDYETLTTAGPSKHQPVARPESQVTGRPLALEWGPNWEDDLAGAPERARLDPNLRDGVEEHVRLEYEKAFMFYLPRICEHCLNPSCVASCPSGAMYKRAEDGIVLVDQEQCRSWRMCVSGCPYKKVYFNWSTGKAEKCTLCYPRIEAGQPTICSETCVGKIRYLGVVLYDADRVQEAASVPDEKDLLPAQLSLFLDPDNPEVREQARRDGIAEDWLDAARRSPVYALAVERRARIAPPPRVPDAADGLVRPAALARDEPRGGAGLRSRPGRCLPRDRGAADPDRVPGEPAHRGRPGTGARRAAPARRDAELGAGAKSRRGARRAGGDCRRHGALRDRGDVPAPRDRKVRRAVRDPAGAW